ncbi:MAG: hypothetical protein ACHQYP_02655 [Nitrospiria bacterium]
MQITSISSDINQSQIGSQNNLQQIQQMISSLGSSLSNNPTDITGAQNAYSALTQKLSQLTSGNGSQGDPLSSSINAINSDLTALGKDIKAGNNTAAKTDLNKLSQDLKNLQQIVQQNAQKVHHHHKRKHHHSHHVEGGQNSTSSSSNSSNTIGQPSGGGLGGGNSSSGSNSGSSSGNSGSGDSGSNNSSSNSNTTIAPGNTGSGTGSNVNVLA